MEKNKIFFLTGIALYVISFFQPTIQFSLGVQLLGWESVLIQWSEILVVSNAQDYFSYLFVALTNFWVIGLIIGWFVEGNRGIKYILSVLALGSSVGWLFIFKDNTVILYGYYIWLLSVFLIVTSRFINEKR